MVVKIDKKRINSAPAVKGLNEMQNHIMMSLPTFIGLIALRLSHAVRQGCLKHVHTSSPCVLRVNCAHTSRQGG